LVPVEFLTDVQAEAYGRFVGPPSRRELDGFFFLDDADLRMVGRRRGNDPEPQTIVVSRDVLG
jgi:Domain of unknown function (DUF4158)